jgi:hypothetical protein
MSNEELEAVLDNLTGVEPAPPPAPEQEPEVPVEDEQPDDAPEEPSEPTPSSDEVDLSALEREGDKLAREKLEAQLELVMAHNSRLAGKLGFLEQKLNSAPVSSEPYEPQTQQDVDRLTLLERRLEESESKRNQAEVSQAIADSVGRLDGPWVQDLAEEIAAVAPKYADQIRAAQESNDPELARQIATAVATVVKAEATQMKWAVRHEAMVKQKEAATVDMARAKRAQTPSGSGGVPPPQSRPKTFADMNAKELDDWLKTNVS